MWQGQLVAIYTGAVKREPLHETPEANLVPGRGLEGDRYFGRIKGGREVTLIEEEALVAAKREYGLDVPAIAIRRNLLVRNVPLNHLMGKTFTVGGVTLEGIELCEPCLHMEGLAGVKGIRAALIHRGGLSARIVTGGAIRKGDRIALSKPL